MATNNSINTPTITLGGSFTMVGAFTFAGTITANTAVTYPVSGTLLSTLNYPAPGATAGKFIISNGTDWIASTPTIPNTAGTSGKILVSDGTNYISSTPTFPNASATSRKMIVSDGTNWVASTETWAVPGSSGNVLTSDGTNWTSATPAVAVPTGTMFNLQQTQLTSTVNFTSTSPTMVDVGLSVAITPTSASNKVLVRAVLSVGCGATTVAYFQLVRGSTVIGVGDAAGSRGQSGQSAISGFAAVADSCILEWLDSPATTSATTYKLQGCSANGSIVYLNRSVTDTNNNTFSRTVSVITVCEVKV